MFTYDTAKKLLKILAFISSGLVAILGFAEFFKKVIPYYHFDKAGNKVLDKHHRAIDYIVCLYMIGLAALWILIELQIKKVIRYFNFMKSFIGKGSYCLLLGFLSFKKSFWYTITVAVLLWVFSACYYALAIYFFDNEKPNFNFKTFSQGTTPTPTPKDDLKKSQKKNNSNNTDTNKEISISQIASSNIIMGNKSQEESRDNSSKYNTINVGEINMKNKISNDDNNKNYISNSSSEDQKNEGVCEDRTNDGN